jgi:XTP/dITP diphosphohydrolase
MFEGTCKGNIALALNGTGGFGYDPLFIPDGYEQTFAELGLDVKSAISHRKKAVEQMNAFLKTIS